MILGRSLDKFKYKLFSEATGGVGGDSDGGYGGGYGGGGSGGNVGGQGSASDGGTSAAQAAGDLAAKLGIGHAGIIGQGYTGSPYGGASSIVSSGEVEGASELDVALLQAYSKYKGFQDLGMLTDVGQKALDSAIQGLTDLGYTGLGYTGVSSLGSTNMGDIAADLGIGYAGQTGQVGIADQSYEGFGSDLSADILGAISRSNMDNPSAVNDAYESMTQNMDFTDKVSLAQAFYSDNIPTALEKSWNTIAPTVASTAVATTAAAIGAALSGNLADHSESESEGAGGLGGPGGDEGDIYLPAGLSDDNLADLESSLEGDINMSSDTDLLAQLEQIMGYSDADRISFNVGNQTVSVLPKAKRDEISLLIDYLNYKTGNTATEASIAANEPSTVDKASQLIGLGADALGLWSGISSWF